MAAVIKDVLREELENSRLMLASYQRELEQLPPGCLVRRQIKKHDYYYQVFREAGKVRTVYHGHASAEEIAQDRENRQRRAQYRRLLAECKSQIQFLEKVLRK